MSTGLKRDNSLDWVKGVCILLMVYGHTSRLGLYAEVQSDIIKAIYQFHMPVFIVISGYLFGWRMGSWEAVCKVFSHVLRPYFVLAPLLVALLLVAGKLGLSTTNQPPETVFKLIIALLTGKSGGALWFLYALGVVQMGILCTSMIGQSLSFSRSIVFVITMCIFTLLGTLNTAVNINFILFFLIGVGFREVFKEMPSSWIGLPIMLLIWCLWLNQKYYNVLTQIALVLSIIMWLYKTADTFSASEIVRGGAWIGRHTLPILAFHSIFNIPMRQVAPAVLRYEETGIMWFVLNVVLVVAFSLLLELILRRMKLYRFLFGGN